MGSSEIINALGLISHPEGGYFREIYRNNEVISDTELNQKYSGKRNLATSIYFLLESGQVSKLHQLKSDELWYFHYGTPLLIHIFYKDEYKSVVLGPKIDKKEKFQAIIPAGAIFGAEVTEPNSYTLIGCMVAPGFHFDDFRLVSQKEVVQQYPGYNAIISRLT
jgi:predicted cupin superfamily sugar epimerase